MSPTAKLISDVLHAAAAESPRPIPAEHLIHPVESLKRNYLGARLCGLALLRLHDDHKVSTTLLARALGNTYCRTESRIRNARKLKLNKPWSNIYAELP